MSIFDEISQKLQRADGEAVAALVHSAAAEYPPADILSKGLLSGMNTVGEKFRKKRLLWATSRTITRRNRTRAAWLWVECDPPSKITAQ